MFGKLCFEIKLLFKPILALLGVSLQTPTLLYKSVCSSNEEFDQVKGHRLKRPPPSTLAGYF